MKNIPEVQAVLDRMITEPLDDIKGQLKRVDSHSNLLILEFEDNRWAAFRARTDYDGESEIEYIRNPSTIDAWELGYTGLITSDAVRKQSNLVVEQTRQRIEADEEKIYQRVKARKEAHGKA